MDRAHGKPCRYRFIHGLLLFGCLAAVIAASYAEDELQRGINNVVSAMDGIIEILEQLQDITLDMAKATAAITADIGQIECDGAAPSGNDGFTSTSFDGASSTRVIFEHKRSSSGIDL